MPTLVATTSGKADRVLLSLQSRFEESQALPLPFIRHARVVSLLPGRIRSLHMFGNRWVRCAEAIDSAEDGCRGERALLHRSCHSVTAQVGSALSGSCSPWQSLQMMGIPMA